MSGLRETFIKRCIVERTNKAEIRPEEQSEKAECCRENLWKKKKPVERTIKRETDTGTEYRGKLGWFMSKT